MIFTNQSYLSLELNTKIDLTDITTVEIHYRKPDGATGTWAATKSGKYIVYQFPAGHTWLEGEWLFQPYGTTASGRKALGTIVSEKAVKPLITP
jgi:hypothetical protein